MCFLRCLALGTPIDAHKFEYGVGRSTTRKFFHQFLNWFVEDFYEEWVRMLETEDDIEDLERPYSMAGLPGCFCSIDGVHVAWDRCKSPEAPIAKGAKGYPFVVFTVCSSNTRRILSVQGPWFGATNDKTTVRQDHFVQAVRTMYLFINYAYQVIRTDGTERTLKGAWILCDGGYHAWQSTMSPFAPPIDDLTAAWTDQ